MTKAKIDKLKAVIYTRVSSKEQEKEGFSIPSQQKLLRKYAADHGYKVIQEYVDIETAKKAGRTNFSEMVKFLEKESKIKDNSANCRTILVEKTDRLYRNIKDWVTLDDFNLEIHFVKENLVISSNARSSEKFIHGIKVLMAKNYIDNLSEETKKGMIEKAEQGLYPSRASIGYINVIGSDKKKRLEPDPKTAPIITKIYELYSTGKYLFQDLSHIAIKDGLFYKDNKEAITLSTIAKILHNKLYMGYFEWKGRTYKGIHQPLVSVELWKKVQNISKHRNFTKPHKVKKEFLFSRLLTCGHCGCALVGEIKKKHYIYYHCTGRKGKCPEKYVREEVLEEKFASLLKTLFFDEEVMVWVTKALKESHEDKKKYLEETIIRLQSEYNKLQNRIDTMYIDKLDGKIDGNFYQQKSTEWKSEQNRIMRTIEQHQEADWIYMD